MDAHQEAAKQRLLIPGQSPSKASQHNHSRNKNNLIEVSSYKTCVPSIYPTM